MTTSWDCFDTLVTRRRMDPLSVLDDMGEMYGLKDFTSRRKAAETRAPWTLASIYTELGKDFGWTSEEIDRYMQAEIKAEIEHCCPISQNIQQVKDGDLVVSDMYLPRWAVRRILIENGLNIPPENVIVTTGGKHNGTIWKDLPEIQEHVGDNYHSDVVSPQAYGIKGRHFTDHCFTEFEDAIGGDLALLMRVLRLSNPYSQTDHPLLYAMWIDQAWFNIPVLILVALELPADNVAFMMRDCVHLQRIHQALHATVNPALHCSRVAFQRGGAELRRHIEAVGTHRTIVDLQGTGESITRYWNETFRGDPTLLYVTGSGKHGRVLIESNHDALERFNSSPMGSMERYPMRYPCEFHPLVLQCQTNAISCALTHLKYFSFSPNLELARRLIDGMFNTVTMRHNVHVPYHS